ncbi:hypothetical protein, partial [Xanthomonas populi]|uniref:hypothetical protein n=1 Tax=Xanthomonas populi TaxID=53414 RepID=UPI001ABF79DB
IHLHAVDIRTRGVQGESDPSNAGTEHLGSFAARKANTGIEVDLSNDSTTVLCSGSGHLRRAQRRHANVASWMACSCVRKGRLSPSFDAAAYRRCLHLLSVIDAQGRAAVRQAPRGAILPQLMDSAGGRTI